MGIMINQQGKEWSLALREEWGVEENEVDSLLQFFISARIPVELKFQTKGTLIYLVFQDVKKVFPSFEDMKDTLDKLLEFKLIYGDIRGKKDVKCL